MPTFVWVNLQRPLLSILKPFSLTAFKLKLVHALCDGYSGRKWGLKGMVQVNISDLKPGHSLDKINEGVLLVGEVVGGQSVDGL